MSEGSWHEVAEASAIEEDAPIKVDIGEEEIALFNVGGEIFATHNICTHAFASMADGIQDGVEIECPLHDGRFNIKTGEALCPPVTEPLKTFEVKVEGGKVFVKA